MKFLKTNQATDAQILKLKYEAYGCAIILAPLRTAICRIAPGVVITGENLRPYLTRWYNTTGLPETIRTYLVKTWIIPTADQLLYQAGYKTHNTEMLLNNLTYTEANYLIKQFQTIKQQLQKPKTTIKKIIKYQQQIRRKYGQKQTI